MNLFADSARAGFKHGPQVPQGLTQSGPTRTRYHILLGLLGDPFHTVNYHILIVLLHQDLCFSLTGFKYFRYMLISGDRFLHVQILKGHLTG